MHVSLKKLGHSVYHKLSVYRKLSPFTVNSLSLPFGELPNIWPQTVEPRRKEVSLVSGVDYFHRLHRRQHRMLLLLLLGPRDGVVYLGRRRRRESGAVHRRPPVRRPRSRVLVAGGVLRRSRFPPQPDVAQCLPRQSHSNCAVTHDLDNLIITRLKITS